MWDPNESLNFIQKPAAAEPPQSGGGAPTSPPPIQPLIIDVATDITEAEEKPPQVFGLGTSLAQRWQGEGVFV